jgi:hypothetical protein
MLIDNIIIYIDSPENYVISSLIESHISYILFVLGLPRFDKSSLTNTASPISLIFSVKKIRQIINANSLVKAVKNAFAFSPAMAVA